MELWLWRPCCGIIAVNSWLWNHCCGFLAVESLLWNPGCGIVAMDSWLWNPSCGILAVESLLWNPDCGILDVESWLWKHLEASGEHLETCRGHLGLSGPKHPPSPQSLHPASKRIRQNPYREISVWGTLIIPRQNNLSNCVPQVCVHAKII